jgi:hypothetical protein
MVHFLHSSIVDSGWLHILTIVNGAKINMDLHTFWYAGLIFCGYIPRSEIAVAYSKSIFSVLKNPHVLPVVAVLVYIPSYSI